MSSQEPLKIEEEGRRLSEKDVLRRGRRGDIRQKRRLERFERWVGLNLPYIVFKVEKEVPELRNAGSSRS